MMSGTHNLVLVWISILISVITSFTALDLAARVRESDVSAKRIWLATAAMAMGGGIWAMHFVAMLAFSMPSMSPGYDVALTFLSLVVAVFTTGVGFTMVTSGSRYRRSALWSAGMIMGFGVVAMHYLGMAAMQMPADLSYDPFWVGVSILIAIGASTAALWLSLRRSGLIERAGAALLMGAAIAGMHFAGMRAAVFSVHSMGSGDHGISGLSQPAIAIAVALTTFMILGLALSAAVFDRRIAKMAAREAAALRRNEDRFRALYKGTPLPLHSLDSQGCIEHVSDAWLKLLGYSREEVIGRPFVHFLSEASARVMLQDDWGKLLAEGEILDRDYCVICNDGRFIEVLLSARVERDAEGNFVQVLGGLADVTARKRTEEALRQSQKMEAIGHLTGGVAHDFNNLLAVVIGNLDLVSKRLPDDPKISRLVANALEGARRGSTLTQRLLAFARKQNLKPESVSVPELVRGMSDLISRSLGPLVEIQTRFPLSLPKVHVDGHQLELAILNLAVNARDAMPEGGSVEISADDEVVGAGGEMAPGRYVRIALKDSGEGMDEATLARATEPFFTSKGTGRGTGLGLSMVQGFAAQSGGRLVLASHVGKGTVAEIWLPASAEAPQEASDTIKLVRKPTPLEAKALLVVDDDPLVLANTVAMLEDDGHAVSGAASGREALELVRSGQEFDLLITDYLMPGMNGLKLAVAVSDLRPGLPVLLVSGYAQLSPDEVCNLPILSKPFDQVELAEAVSSALGKSNVLLLRRA